MKIKNVLIDEFNDEMEEISKLQVGGSEHKQAVDSVTKLADRIIEIEKLEIESDEKIQARIEENELRLQQLQDEKKDRKMKNGIAIGTGLLSLLAYGLAFIGSMNFEKEGTLTTQGGRDSLKKLFNLRF